MLSIVPRFTLAAAARPGGTRGVSSTSVAAKYTPLRKHSSLFEPENVAKEWLHPDYAVCLEQVRAANIATDMAWMIDDEDQVPRLPPLVEERARQIFSFPLLRDDCCDRLIEEIEHFQTTGLPARRPNSMNNYGLILNEIGLRHSLDALQALIHPLARSLFPVEGAVFDGHHSFCVSYKPDEDRGLDMHSDDSDVTLNVCLGKEFEAAGLTFCGDVGAPGHRKQSFCYKHAKGVGLLHLGRRRHGADDISDGHRVNLIMWNWNSEYRATPAFRARPYFREEGAPDPECVSWTHDRDWEAILERERPAGGEKFAGTAWCPPPQAEYEGFAGKGGRYRDRLLGSPDDIS